MALGSDLVKHYPPLATIRTIIIKIVLWYLRLVAKLALRLSHATIIGIAGSVGKTTTRNALDAILSSYAPTVVVSGNSETGVPLGLVGLKPIDYSLNDWIRLLCMAPFGVFHLHHAHYIIVEMGIDDPYPPKNMEYLLTIIKPHIGIITYESAAHTMQFEKVLTGYTDKTDKEKLNALINMITREDAKMLLTDNCRLGIVNIDCEPLTNLFPNHPKPPKLPKPPILKFGTSGDSDLLCTDYTVSLAGSSFTFKFKKTNQTVTIMFPRYLFPLEMQYVFAPVLLVCRHLDIPFSLVTKTLEENFTPPNGRESVFEGIGGTTIIDSTYNASKPSTLSFLRLLRALGNKTHRPRVALLADMLELGSSAKVEHEEVARALVLSADHIYLVGNLTREHMLPILEKKKSKRQEVCWFDDFQKLNEYLLAHLPSDAIVLVKGSEGKLWLEETIKLLLKNKEAVKHLCRQDEFWVNVKKRANRWIDI